MIFQTRTQTKWAVGAVVLSALAGCGGNREAQLAGTWKVKPMNLTLPTPAPGSPGANPAAQQFGQQMAQSMMSSMSLDLKADKSFTMNMMLAMEGNWALSGNALSLTMTKMAGMDISKMPNANKANNEPLVLTLSDDGSELTMQDKSGKPSPLGGPMVFVKQ